MSKINHFVDVSGNTSSIYAECYMNSDDLLYHSVDVFADHEVIPSQMFQFNDWLYFLVFFIPLKVKTFPQSTKSEIIGAHISTIHSEPDGRSMLMHNVPRFNSIVK